MFICKSIIESHGGKLWFEDNKDRKGVTFFFSLPMYKDDKIKSLFSNEILEKKRSKDNLLTNSNRGIQPIIQKEYPKDTYKTRILLVDDDNDINLTLKKILEEKGYYIHEFSNPLDVIQKFRKGIYNLIILDIKMPKMNSFEFYNEIIEIDNT